MSAAVLAGADARGPAAASHAAPLLREPWCHLDDAALLAHFRGPRPVQLDLVVDEDECTPEKLAGVMQGRFTFNGETHALPEPLDWLHNPSRDVEWHILLHKAYYAPGLARQFQASGDPALVQRWAALLEGWMQQVPPGFIAADVTGRRVQNWLYSLHGFLAHGQAHQASVEPTFLGRLLQSLHEQVEHLCHHLTAKRNHRTLELYAIFLAGVALPEMRRAAHWRHFALQETAANLQADLLPDGVHCELSTDYHHLALRNWLHVRRLAVRHGVALPAGMDAALQRALRFSLHVHAPGGMVPSFSDGDARSWLPLLAEGAALFGDEQLRWGASQGRQGRPPAQEAVHFADSGYAVLRSSWGQDAQGFGAAQHLVFDCGPLGEGNHGHFDCLSFELACGPTALVVDPGRCTYSEAGETNWRVHFRGTAAHNTVCVDGVHQTAYRPRPVPAGTRHGSGSVRHKVSGPGPEAQLRRALQAPGFALLHGVARSHAYDAVHERLLLRVDALWIVSDRLHAPTPHRYTLNFQLNVAAEGATRLSQGAHWRLDSPGLVMLQPQREGVHATLGRGWVSPRYGEKHAAPALRAHAEGPDAAFDTVLLPGGASEGAALAWSEAGGLVLTHEWIGHPCRTTWLPPQAEGTRRQGAGWAFEGPWLLLQQHADGRLLQAFAPAGACLRLEGEPAPITHPGAITRIGGGAAA